MPMQIKIKSSAADISEYDAPKPTEKEDKTDKETPENKTSDSKDDKESEEPVDKPKEELETENSETTEKEGEGDHNETGGVQYEYEGDEVFYTDPSSKVRYRWDKEQNSWVSQDGGKSVPPSMPSSENYIFDGDTYFYRDESGKKHKWNQTKNEWEEQEESDESEEDDNTTEEERRARQYRKRKAAPGWDNKKYEKDPVSGKTIYRDPLDKMVYEWDEDKKAWFPQLGEDFMAAYQLNYGFTNDLESKPTVPEPPKEDEVAAADADDPAAAAKPAKQKKTKKEVEPPKWFEEDEAKSTKVYVSGLPDTITEKEFEEIMAKCGMVEHDVRTKKSKLKIYKDENGTPKGDGLCTYIKHESVELALTIIDGSEYKGKTLKVERAKFQMKGESYDPKLKPKKLNKKEKEKAAKQREKLFAWIPDKMKGERGKNEKVIVIKNLFDPLEFSADPAKIIDYSGRIRSQCSKFGTITRLTLYDKHVEGICQIHFKEASEADLAIEMLNGRLFGKRIMKVEQWDGRTKYKQDAEETKEEEAERLSAWEKYLEGEDEDVEASKKQPETSDKNATETEKSDATSETRDDDKKQEEDTQNTNGSNHSQEEPMETS